jgi:hypothetical protein
VTFWNRKVCLSENRLVVPCNWGEGGIGAQQAAKGPQGIFWNKGNLILLKYDSD